MKRIVSSTALASILAAATAALALGAGSQAAKHPALAGTVGKNDAYKISLTASNGKAAKTLKAGTYTIVIHDDSALHNYELDGPHGKSWTFTSVTKWCQAPLQQTRTRRSSTCVLVHEERLERERATHRA